jgi:hypothetical protein
MTKQSNSQTETLTKKRFQFNFSKEEKFTYLLLAGIILLVVMIRSNFLDIPFERDEGIYGYNGKLALEGKAPYKDFYEQKFPGLFYFYAVMVAIFGDTVRGLHTGFMILNIGTILFVFAAVKRLFSPMAAVVSAFTYAIVSMTPNLSGFTVQSEHGVAFFSAMGIYFFTLVRSNPSFRNLFIMGIALGAAFMTKTTGIFLLFWGGLAVIADFLLSEEKRTVKEFFRRTIIFSSGAVLITGFLFLIVIAKGSLQEMLFWTIDIPKRYVSKVPWEEGKKYLGYSYQAITKEYKWFWMHAILGLISVFILSISWRKKLPIILLAACSALTIFPGFFFYGHYWIQILPGLAVITGLTFYSIVNLLQKSGVKSDKLNYAYVVIFAVCCLLHLNRLKDYYFNPNYERVLRNVYGNNPFPETAKIADYINNNSQPEDQLVLIGSEPQLYFYTRKRCPSRHAYFSALVDNVAEAKDWQKEFIADVEKAKPRFVIFYNHPLSLLVQKDADQSVFEWYNKYVTENYNLIGLVDMIEGYSSTYVWKEQLATYAPQAQNRIYIFEKKVGV